MRFQSQKVAVLIVTALLIATACWLLPPPQPRYQGKVLSKWLQDFDFGGPRRAAAQAAIRGMGTNAVPILVRYLTHETTPLQRRVLAFTETHAFGVQLVQDDFLWHRRAALALGALGSAAEPALPTLARAVTNSQAPEEVIDALGRMLPRSAGILTNAAITCPSQIGRNRAMASLAEACAYPEISGMCIAGLSNALTGFLTGPAAIGALAGLRDGSKSPEIREAAALALKTAHPMPQYPDSVNSLIDGPAEPVSSQLQIRYGMPTDAPSGGLPARGP